MDAPEIVGVAPDVTGIDRIFDYSVPENFRSVVELGTRVRVILNGRRVGGWVVRLGAAAEDRSTPLRPLDKVSGVGPDEEVLAVCVWAARRWCAQRLRPLLVTASSPTMVSRPAPRHRTRVLAEPSSPAAADLLERGGGVLRLPPSDDQMPAILAAARRGPTLVVVPNIEAARVLAIRLRRTGMTVAFVPEEWAAARGGVDVVIGSRSAAFAPCPGMAVAVVIDEHDESLQEERTPTWHARDVVAERARRLAVPVLLVSPCPTLDATHGRNLVAPPRERERNGWPTVVVVDPGDVPPWKRSLLSSELIAELRDPTRRIACVLNSKGQARLLACRSCRALTRCENCGSSLVESDESRLECPVCVSHRLRVCPSCGSGSLVRLRPGVTRLRGELEAAAQRDVVAVTAADQDIDDTACDVFVGTEAVLHRVRRMNVVAFLDLDAELLAPRFRAAEQAMALLVRAARMVGPRRSGGRVLLQTTLPDHPVVRAVVDGDPSIVESHEREQRRVLALPPYTALAVVQGAGAAEFASAVALADGSVSVVAFRDRWLVRAPDHEILSQACETVERSTKVRIEVDPPRL
ncbi:MAG: hypothetical protein ACO3SP_04330 [Ilumatobacteraceae bacterium]